MMSFTNLQEQLLALVVKTSTDLPCDVEKAISQAQADAVPGSPEGGTLQTMLRNVAIAREKRMPICQDTGALLFQIKAPAGIPHNAFERAACAAVAQATAAGVLRQNCVETLTGRNTGNNLGYGLPVFHWMEEEREDCEVSLMLKGGGSENMGVQYSLPDSSLDAGRDLEGVRKCLLDAVQRAQGNGCAPGILGVCIGGDRATGYEESKAQLFRKIGERSPEPLLAELEKRVLAEANSLGIGPMGLGGKTTLLEVFIGTRCRIPASYFVSVTYMCWCCRRQTVHLALL
ncbi:MAG: fumarate hydratase [Victivallales bacterium]|nr:fumarate hydratase [Victivallales bacterium]